MNDVGTLSGLVAHQHSLAAYCQHCDRWTELNFGAMVAAGLGDRRLPVKVRCQSCGGPAAYRFARLFRLASRAVTLTALSGNYRCSRACPKYLMPGRLQHDS